MKYRSASVFLALAIPLAAAESSVIEQIIAKVNGEIITRSELTRARKQLEAELKARNVTGADFEKAIEQHEKDVLRDRIDQLLLVQKAKEVNINVESQLAKYMAEVQAQSKVADPDKFQAWIREQTGMPFEDFKSERRNQMLTQGVIRQEVGGRIVIPRAEIEKYYNEHKDEFIREERVFLREIFLSTEGKTDAEAAAIDKKAKDLVARARKGERFFELARDNSESDTARQGGELPPFKRGELMKQIEDQAFTQERGWVSDPIKTDKGFVIVRLEERHKAGQAQLEEVENDIMEKLYAPRMEPAVREYLTKLRQEAFLEIREGYVDTSAAPGKSTKWTDPAQLKPETVTKEEVASQTRRKRLLWMIPIPGTTATPKSSSK